MTGNGTTFHRWRVEWRQRCLAGHGSSMHDRCRLCHVRLILWFGWLIMAMRRPIDYPCSPSGCVVLCIRIHTGEQASPMPRSAHESPLSASMGAS
jgi:hypothetical protein